MCQMKTNIFPAAPDECRVRMLPALSIAPNPSQPRRFFADETILSLADSIRRHGILQPLSVRLIDGMKYELIAGERRLRAAKLIGMKDVPCLVIAADERRSAELAIIENLQREDLNIFEQAGAIASLIDIYGLTQEQAAKRLSSSQSYVANKLRILKLTSEEREIILKHGLSERHARTLLRIDDPERRLAALEHIAEASLNVSQSEEYVDRILTSPEPVQPESASKTSEKGRERLILKDIRIFYNTVDRAVETMERAGVAVTSERHESDDFYELLIKVRKTAC